MTHDPGEKWDRDIDFSEEDDPASSWRTELRDPAEEEVEWIIRDVRPSKPANPPTTSPVVERAAPQR